jgi:hypothetical protein
VHHGAFHGRQYESDPVRGPGNARSGSPDCTRFTSANSAAALIAAVVAAGATVAAIAVIAVVVADLQVIRRQDGAIPASLD